MALLRRNKKKLIAFNFFMPNFVNVVVQYTMGSFYVQSSQHVLTNSPSGHLAALIDH